MRKNYLIDDVSLNYDAVNIKTYIDFKQSIEPNKIELIIDGKSIGLVEYKNYAIRVGMNKQFVPIGDILNNDFVAHSRLKLDINTTLRLTDNKKDVEIIYQNKAVGYVRATKIKGKKGMFVRVYNKDNEPKCYNIDELF